MKYVWRLAFIGVILSPVAKAEDTILRAFENFEQRIENLENYSVLYWETQAKRRYVVMKSAPARQTHKSDDGLSVELRPANKGT
jgi:hypothetical protein